MMLDSYKEYMKRINLFLFLSVAALPLWGEQKTVPRIEQMPNIPSGYEWRDWKSTAVAYDQFVFDLDKSGEHLPLVSISTTAGVNYPEVKPIRLDTYVGSNSHGSQAEAINIMPAVVGATLVGVDKTAHFGTDWVSKLKDFFNRANGQNVYLNNYSSGTGNDWWYETMPNVFFYQLASLYPGADSDFAGQLTTIADRQLDVLFKLGGSMNPWLYPDMNHRAFNLLTGKPLSTGVPEPEAAGAIAWILYQAWLETGETRYRSGAELALDFLKNWDKNPSYEIQLPYGIVTAARMNALEGTKYDLDKFMNWTFSSGVGTLRSWGTIVGNWNGYEMSGLIGEAMDAGNDYAFLMNGFQHAAALAPVAKYDKRYARALGKWLLNLSNASRYFYPDALPAEHQQSDSHAWSVAHDPESCIPYEAIKQQWQGVKPCAMGDAARNGWAATDLSLYSGSSVGYLAALLEQTAVEGILQIDLNATDFRRVNASPVYLYYNPYGEAKEVTLTLPDGVCSVYDAISETVVAESVSGTVKITISADGVCVLTVYDAARQLQQHGRFLCLPDGEVIDYHYGYDYTNSLRVKALTADKETAMPGDTLHFNCQVENYATYTVVRWYVDGEERLSGRYLHDFNWEAPAAPGEYEVHCVVSDREGATAESPVLRVRVVPAGLVVPEIGDIVFSPSEPLPLGGEVSVQATLNTRVDKMQWSCSDGSLAGAETMNPVWTLPQEEGVYELTLTVENELGEDTETVRALVKDLDASAGTQPIIHYPFDGNTENAMGDVLDAVSVNAVPAADAKGDENHAYRFQNSSQYIYIPESDQLNISGPLAVACWLNPDRVGGAEQYVISHGSYEERFKLSITPDKLVRWTLKTDQSTVDVDDPEAIQPGKFVHYTAQYTGYALELYRNGRLVAYKPQMGVLGTTAQRFTVARKTEAIQDYSYFGVVDELKLFDTDLSVTDIRNLPDVWGLPSRVDVGSADRKVHVWPNPFRESFVLGFPSEVDHADLELLDLQGQLLYVQQEVSDGERVVLPALGVGVYLLRLTAGSGETWQVKVLKQEAVSK